MSLSTQPYKGSRDFYPEDKRLLNYVFEKWRNTCLMFGYEEYDAPILEPIELFAAKSGDEIVNEQTYSFTDRGGREVAIRPEMTPSISRMVAGRRQELALPIRWFSVPNCWRYERPQKGRGREFYQLNIDLFGVSGIEAEIEMLQIVRDIMKSFGAKQSMYTVKINSRSLVDTLLRDVLKLDEVERKTIVRLIDRMHKMDSAEFVSLLEAAITPAKRDAGVAHQLEAVLNVKALSELPEAFRRLPSVIMLQEIQDSLTESGIKNIVFDISLMRGLDYYTDFVFEVFDNDPENNRSLFGGGRYDGLVGMFGVEPLPTVGFAISDVVDLVRAAALKPDFYDIDLQAMIKEILDLGVEIKACGTSLKRSGEYKNEPYLNENIRGSLDILGAWTIEAKQALRY